MNVRRPVEAYADGNMPCLEKFDPAIVEQRRIGLQFVADGRGVQLGLDGRKGALIEVHGHRERLARVPEHLWIVRDESVLHEKFARRARRPRREQSRGPLARGRTAHAARGLL